VGLSDRLRAWLRGDDDGSSGSGTPARAAGSGAAGRASRRRGRGDHPSGTFDTTAMLEFVRTRRGVEVYLEPRTRLYGASVLLVADDGEYLRRPVPDAAAVQRFCSAHGVPVYDAARTGYPRRVRDYDRGVRPQRIDLADLPPWPDGSAPDEEPPPPPGAPA
jgi:hypothetical protein